MIKAKYWLSLGVLGAVLVLAGAAMNVWAAPEAGGSEKMEAMQQDGPGPEGDDDSMMGHRMMGQLNLTADQISKLKAERTETRKQMIRDMAEIKVMHMDLAEESMNDKPDMGKIEKMIRQITERQAKMMLQRTKSVIFLNSILTPEQKQKMSEMHLQMGGGMGMGMMGDRHFKRGNKMGRKDCVNCGKK